MERRILSHYAILEKLGEGGMGVVYKSQDTRLDRLVAVKVLPTSKTADPERKRRFIQEAKAASALNHPNIITIYEIDETDGIDFIAMEYVAGRTLDQLMAHGGIRLNEALHIGSQIADGLAAAHSAGIVHRDIKPSNIMITDEGRVKVVDFGLAKLIEHTAEENGPTRTLTAQTEKGAIVGTVAYMSPEQAEGKSLDARSDVFSFGTVLYEMITGHCAFRRQTNISTIAAIINQEPQALPTSVPHDVERVISRCLRKDPARRFQHMGDIKITLDELYEELNSGKVATSVQARAKKRILIWAATVFFIGMTVGLGWWWTGHPRQTPPPVVRALTWNYSGLSTDPALSPDGSLLAFASDRSGNGNLDIWVKHLAGGEPRRLTDDPTDDHQPSFSPDGSRIAFRSERQGGGIYVVSALGGDARLIAKDGFWPRYSPDGSRIAYGAGRSGLQYFVIPAEGGEPWKVKDIVGSASPGMAWSPDGGHLLLWGVDQGRRRPTQDLSDWWVAPAGPASSEPAVATKTKAVDALRRYILDGPGPPGPPIPWTWLRDRVIFSARGSIWEAPFSMRSLAITGEPRRLTFGTEAQAQPALTPGGLLVYTAGSSTIGLWELPVEANEGKPAGTLRRIEGHAISEWLPTLSADGTQVAFISLRLDGFGVGFKDLKSGKEKVLTARTPAPLLDGPVISRDGSAVIYSLGNTIYSVPIAGSIPRKLCDSCRKTSDWSRSGTKILFQYRVLNPKSTIGLLDLTTGEKVEILKHGDYDLYRGHFSPDERWLVFHADRDTRELREFIAPFRGARLIPENEWIAVTDGKTFADAPRWSSDGNLIYYISERDGFRCIWAQRLDRTTRRPVGDPFVVQHFHERQRSLRDVSLNSLDLAISGGRLVFTLGEQRGNIYAADLGKSLR